MIQLEQKEESPYWHINSIYCHKSHINRQQLRFEVKRFKEKEMQMDNSTKYIKRYLVPKQLQIIIFEQHFSYQLGKVF